MKWTWKYWIGLLFVGCLLLTAAGHSQEAATWGSNGTTAAPASDEGPALKPMKLRSEGPTFRERRAMGVTWRNVKRILAEKQAAGELEGKDRSVVAMEVFDQLVQDNPKAFMDAKAVPGRDWSAFFEALIAFLEKLIPLILMFI